MVIIEAMACGLAVASFDCPWGPRSIIKDGEDGLLVENGNVGELADALVTLIQDSAKRESIAKYAIQNVKRFQMEKIAEQWRQLFEGAIRS
jgi:glycosyltransferase involved in cell wall biosynthesis